MMRSRKSSAQFAAEVPSASPTASTCSLSTTESETSLASSGGTQLPLRRAEILWRSRGDSAAELSWTGSFQRTASSSRSLVAGPTGWLRSLVKHPVLATIAGVAQLVGLHRVVSLVAAASSFSLGGSFANDSVAAEDSPLDLYRAAPVVEDASPWDYGFFVAITPPSYPVHGAQQPPVLHQHQTPDSASSSETTAEPATPPSGTPEDDTVPSPS